VSGLLIPTNSTKGVSGEGLRGTTLRTPAKEAIFQLIMDFIPGKKKRCKIDEAGVPHFLAPHTCMST
jgi:hypothetical protein